MKKAQNGPNNLKFSATACALVTSARITSDISFFGETGEIMLRAGVCRCSCMRNAQQFGVSLLGNRYVRFNAVVYLLTAKYMCRLADTM